MSLDEQFNIINDKLQQLLKQHNRIQKENERLQEELIMADIKVASAQQTIHEMEQQVSILRVSSAGMNETDKKEFEKRLNQYLKEVDKCIAFLSE